MPTRIQHCINGTLVSGQSGRSQPVFNPATGEQSGTVPLASAAEMNKAVEAARAAFPAWAKTTPLRRARILNRFLRLLEDHTTASPRRSRPSTARSMPTRRARSRAASRWSSSPSAHPAAPQGRGHRERRHRVDSHSLRQPLGVVAGITPFNFPAMVPMWMFPVALACGNAFILKPSERDPSAPLLIAELLHRGRPARRRLQRRARRQGGGRRPAGPSRRRRRSASSARRRSRATSTRPAPRTESGCRRWAAPRTT